MFLTGVILKIILIWSRSVIQFVCRVISVSVVLVLLCSLFSMWFGGSDFSVFVSSIVVSNFSVFWSEASDAVANVYVFNIFLVLVLLVLLTKFLLILMMWLLLSLLRLFLPLIFYSFSVFLFFCVMVGVLSMCFLFKCLLLISNLLLIFLCLYGQLLL